MSFVCFDWNSLCMFVIIFWCSFCWRRKSCISCLCSSSATRARSSCRCRSSFCLASSFSLLDRAWQYKNKGGVSTSLSSGFCYWSVPGNRHCQGWCIIRGHGLGIEDSREQSCYRKLRLYVIFNGSGHITAWFLWMTQQKINVLLYLRVLLVKEGLMTTKIKLE